MTRVYFAALLLVCASCVKETAVGTVTLTASIADETKATLNESTGDFAFSEGDAIKVYNGSAEYASTSVALDGASATFTMAEGFTDTGSGLAAFPAGIASIDNQGVHFTLPATYTYAEVGGADASAAKVPCPMVASYTAGSDLVFKQAGAVVRFRVTGCKAGSLTFTFTTPVTGTFTLTEVPSGSSDGITATGLTGYSITVTNVPAETTPIFITLPVPVGTDPMNVGVWNHHSFGNMVATLSGTASSLDRAAGHKRGVTLTDVKTTARFDGKILAGDLYFLGNYNYGVLSDPLEVVKLYKVDYTTCDNTDSDIEKCYFNWDFLNQRSFSFTIADKTYRVPSSGESGDWAGIAGTQTTRPKATVKGNKAHYAFLTVTGLTGLDDFRTEGNKLNITSIGGLLLFPDNAIIAVPGGAKLGIFDGDDSADKNTISHAGLTDLLNQGCSFIPTAGFWNKSSWYTAFWGQGWYGINEVGSYWSDSAYNNSHAYALTILRNHTTNAEPNKIDPAAHDEKGKIFYPVRLILVES